ncbi:hypothetical protein E3N88_31189 [Mikania micrantha]|uniref:Cytochrome P450 n=1 Tax=Mikania micrantha TaxID=192012 RepID=A0A5N6MNP9_9ASTR|nr:hypothetical protein E3N88_31189 [Mikania micrantha]
MEVMMGAVVVVLLVLVAYGWQFFNWVWLRPKAMEKSLREQGLTGNRYRFFFGDLKEMHMLPAFHISCSEMIRKWEGITKGRSCEVDVYPYLQTMTSDIISRTAFGSSYEEGRKIFELQCELQKLIVQVLQSMYIPGSRSKGDLLGILLDSNDKVKLQGYTTFGLSIDEVIEECKLFYIGGQETTASLLVWTMILLGQHTNWQDRARDEVSKVFGDRKPDIDGLSHLKLLYPPVVALERIIHEETKIGDLILPSGSQLMLHLMMLHHDANIWGDDVNEFNPERFAEGVSKATKIQASYYPFGGGPRICVGQAFAILQAKLALVMILSRFSFKLSPSYSHAPHIILSLQPQFGAQLILSEL